jgi:hypothetical protein
MALAVMKAEGSFDPFNCCAVIGDFRVSWTVVVMLVSSAVTFQAT